MLRRPFASRAVLLALVLSLACGSAETERDLPTPAISTGPHDVVVLDMGDLGEIHIELLREIAPKTCAHFEELADGGVYAGTTFHRVVPGFMIQGGDPNTTNRDPRDDGHGGNEFHVEDEFTNTPHTRGMVSMANLGQYGSAGSQFFIVHADSPHLDGRYTLFGRVVKGMDVVDAITELEIDTFGRWGPVNRPYPVSATIVAARLESASGSSTAAKAPTGSNPALAQRSPNG